ncbi:hypothetical protein RZS08_50260, partial [Arthrospira platensis SPKY1]|nr:hypothetical protein [Arthrospira platensis SPKY1]
ESLSAAPLQGRLLLLLAADGAKEPRFQLSDEPGTAQVLGIDVEGWKVGEPLTFDSSIFGYPAESLRDIPFGYYWVQAVFHHYETFRRADGHVVKLPMDRGE